MEDRICLNLKEYREILKLTYEEIYKINIVEKTYETLYINNEKYIGFSWNGKYSDELLYKIRNLIHKDDIEYFLKSFRDLSINNNIANKEKCIFKYRRLHNDGKYYWTSHTIYKSNDDSNIHYCMVKDINCQVVDNESYLKKHVVLLQKQLKYQGNYDILTDIYNKNKFYEETSRMLLNNKENSFVMLRFDIERFKVINEFFGKSEGDELLKYIAQKIKYVCSGQSKCTFSRVEADIFCMCFLYTKKGVLETIDYIEMILDEYEIGFEITPKFGAYIIEDNSTPIDLVCDRAGLAIKTVKGNYIKNFAYFDETLRSNLIKEQEIVNDMNYALKNEQFEVYLQPKCELSTGKPVGVEALVRWNHPDKGLIFPNEFIPIFERNGFVMKLDAYIWEKVCKLIRLWMEEGKKPIPISVNISRINLYNPKLCSILLDLVDKYNIPKNMLNLEITESAYTDNQQLVINVVKSLKNHGFIIMMDDFGSGYSSLNILKDIPVDVLKIDLKFLAGDMMGGKGGNILSSIIRMAKWLNIGVIAEGVETKDQADFLYSIGCTIGQGYYFNRPMPINEFEDYINKFKYDNTKMKSESYTDINIDDFWDPKSSVSLLFNTMINPACIYEYRRGNIEEIRINDEYFKLIEITREEFFYNTKNVLDYILESDREEVHKTVLEVINNHNIKECTYRRVCNNGKIKWIHSKISYIRGVDDRHLIYSVMVNASK